MVSKLAQSREDGGAHYDHHLQRTDPLMCHFSVEPRR